MAVQPPGYKKKGIGGNLVMKNKSIKKLTAMVLSAVMVLSMAACGSDSSTETASGDAKAEESDSGIDLRAYLYGMPPAEFARILCGVS